MPSSPARGPISVSLEGPSARAPHAESSLRWPQQRLHFCAGSCPAPSSWSWSHTFERESRLEPFQATQALSSFEIQRPVPSPSMKSHQWHSCEHQKHQSFFHRNRAWLPPAPHEVRFGVYPLAWCAAHWRSCRTVHPACARCASMRPQYHRLWGEWCRATCFHLNCLGANPLNRSRCRISRRSNTASIQGSSRRSSRASSRRIRECSGNSQRSLDLDGRPLWFLYADCYPWWHRLL